MEIVILSIGDEVVDGDTINTNASFLSQRLRTIGHTVVNHVAIRDNENDLLDELKHFSKKVDLIITTGGLGPTADDKTKEVVCKYLNIPLEKNEKIIDDLKNKFKKYDVEMTDNNIKQAFVPQTADILFNERGTAPGYIIKHKRCDFILLPGPPSENQYLYEKYVHDYLLQKSDQFNYEKVFNISGMGESTVEDQIKDLIQQYPNVYIATYASLGVIKLKVSITKANQSLAEAAVEPVIDEIRHRFKGKIINEGNETINTSVCKLLIDNNITIATAESCTGGLISSMIVENSGVSDIYEGGFIVYSNALKERLLGVSKKSLMTYGAVSEQVCREMVIGLDQEFNKDISVAVTGIAGPTGGTEEKPVGLVYIGIKFFDTIDVYQYNFRGNRTQIRERTAMKVFDKIGKKLIIDN